MPSNFLGRELSVCGRMLKWCRLVFGLSSIYSMGVWVGCLTWGSCPLWCCTRGFLGVLEALRLLRRRLRVAVVGGGPLRDAMSLDHSVSLVFRVSEKEKRRILAQSVYYLHLLLPRGLAYRRLRPFRWGCILSFWLLNTIL